VARSRRHVPRGTRKKADWVYRPDVLLEGAPINLGGWMGQVEMPYTGSISAGSTNAQALILLDSQAVLRQMSVFDEFGAASADIGHIPNASRPEKLSRPTVHRVDGTLWIRGTIWTLGARVACGVRLGWYEQDLDSGQLSLDVDYCMWDVATSMVQRGPAICANDSATHIMDWYYVRESGDNPNMGHLNIHWKGKRRAPSEKHCLALYIEGADFGSHQPFLMRRMVRALISE